MRIIRRVEGEHLFALGEGVFASFLGFAAFFGVGDEEAVGECGHGVVALGCDICGGATDVVVEKGEEQEAPFDEGVLPALGNPHGADPPCRADHDGRRPPQHQIQKIFLHWRLEPADERHIRVAKRTCEIVGLEDGIARAAHGTEEANQRVIEEIEVAL